jgi:hypothetical protein
LLDGYFRLLLTQTRHHHGREHGQHLLKNIRADTCLFGCASGNGAAHILAAENMAEDRVPVTSVR